MMASEVMDLPDPDSPTNPKTSPGLMENVRLRTAATVLDPWGDALGMEAADADRSSRATLGNSMVRLRTSSNGGTSVWYQRSYARHDSCGRNCDLHSGNGDDLFRVKESGICESGENTVLQRRSARGIVAIAQFLLHPAVNVLHPIDK
jgi:hypothetical protein